MLVRYLVHQRFGVFVRRCRIAASCVCEVTGSSSSSEPRFDDGRDDSGGGSDKLCGGLRREVEDSWFGTFDPREEAVTPKEDEVDDDSVKKSCENKYHRSAAKSSPEAHCSAAVIVIEPKIVFARECVGNAIRRELRGSEHKKTKQKNKRRHIYLAEFQEVGSWFGVFR